MAKRMVNATFGLSKKNITKKTEAIMDKITSLLDILKVPSEMARRPRAINLSFYKSQVIITHRHIQCKDPPAPPPPLWNMDITLTVVKCF
jgi:hypothetical protein